MNLKEFYAASILVLQYLFGGYGSDAATIPSQNALDSASNSNVNSVLDLNFLNDEVTRLRQNEKNYNGRESNGTHIDDQNYAGTDLMYNGHANSFKEKFEDFNPLKRSTKSLEDSIIIDINWEIYKTLMKYFPYNTNKVNESMIYEPETLCINNDNTEDNESGITLAESGLRKRKITNDNEVRNLFVLISKCKPKEHKQSELRPFEASQLKLFSNRLEALGLKIYKDTIVVTDFKALLICYLKNNCYLFADVTKLKCNNISNLSTEKVLRMNQCITTFKENYIDRTPEEINEVCQQATLIRILQKLIGDYFKEKVFETALLDWLMRKDSKFISFRNIIAKFIKENKIQIPKNETINNVDDFSPTSTIATTNKISNDACANRKENEPRILSIIKKALPLNIGESNPTKNKKPKRNYKQKTQTNNKQKTQTKNEKNTNKQKTQTNDEKN